jgi:hypothetical protein
MRHDLTWVRHNERGNVVTLCKCRSGAPGQGPGEPGRAASDCPSPIGPGPAEVLSSGEELLDKARAVAGRIEGRVWTTLVVIGAQTGPTPQPEIGK